MAFQKNEMKKFGLVGKNIDYSFSRGYFADKFKKNGLLDCRYENYDLKEIKGIISVFKTHGLNGLNVTIPYKKEVLPFLDKLSSQSKKIGAVNTIAFNKNGETTGHNTDAHGFQKSLLEITEKLPVSALILGTGGASAAIAFALETLNIQFNLVSRNECGTAEGKAEPRTGRRERGQEKEREREREREREKKRERRFPRTARSDGVRRSQEALALLAPSSFGKRRMFSLLSNAMSSL